MTTPEPPSGPGPPGSGPSPLYPVSLDLLGAACLVVGGGSVAARKVHGLLDTGATVTVVAPGVGPEVGALMTAGGDRADPRAGESRRGSLSVEIRPYRAGEAAGYRLVVAATGVPAVDAGVVADAQTVASWSTSPRAGRRVRSSRGSPPGRLGHPDRLDRRVEPRGRPVVAGPGRHSPRAGDRHDRSAGRRSSDPLQAAGRAAGSVA